MNTLKNIALVIIVVFCIIAIYYMGYIMAKNDYSKPFYITIDKEGESNLKLSTLRLTTDSLQRDTVFHGGQRYIITKAHYTFYIDPMNYYTATPRVY